MKDRRACPARSWCSHAQVHLRPTHCDLQLLEIQNFSNFSISSCGAQEPCAGYDHLVQDITQYLPFYVPLCPSLTPLTLPYVLLTPHLPTP